LELFLIDAIGPFFRDYQKKTINWSKIPFEHVETVDPVIRAEQFGRIREDMRTLAKAVAADGYNAATLDDLAHLATSQIYEPIVQERILALREEFRPLMRILTDAGLTPYITADILSYTPALREAIGTEPEAIADFLADLVDRFLGDFPEVGGIIFRIGESDGRDVEQRFTSELVLRKPQEVNLVLRRLLPVFEKHEKKLILRTWTVGAYHIGDLIWHRGTLARTVKGIDSKSFVLSMKYGESDFFRHLALNRAFFQGPQQKIIELQSRREYEGCGEFPSFIGSDYNQFATELHQAQNVIGLSTWSQTGGWVWFRRLAYLQPEGIWTEINAAVSVLLFRDSASIEQAVREVAKRREIEDWASLLELLRLSEEVVKELIYVRHFAVQTLFFRRVRIPPLVAVYWDSIFINHSVRKLLRHFVPGIEGERAVREGRAALEKIDQMVPLAEKCGLPVEDIKFLRATGELLAAAREYYFLPYSPDVAERIESAKVAYEEAYPIGTRPRYRIQTNFDRFRLKRWHLRWSMALATRKNRSYRILDHLVTLHLLGFVYRLIQRRRPKWVPDFAKESAMGIDTIFR